jgi:cyclopropane-fatty-acyl-phospholipid synthase
MFEHVGPKNYHTYFEMLHRVLDPQGLCLLHTIGLDRPASATDPWIERYVFPGGKLPGPDELMRAAQTRFIVEDWHNFGPDYDRTLMAWHANFEQAWPQLRSAYSERFRRMWRYYLLSCAGFFRSRQGQLWQLVLSRRERVETYRSRRLAG